MDETPIFELEFVCPRCNKKSTIVERALEVSEDEIISFELISYEYDEENKTITDVADIEVATSLVGSYSADPSQRVWLCSLCHQPIPVDSREELFLWLYAENMLVPSPDYLEV